MLAATVLEGGRNWDGNGPQLVLAATVLEGKDSHSTMATFTQSLPTAGHNSEVRTISLLTGQECVLE